MVIQMGVAPKRIDILTSISGVSYSEVADNKFYVEIDGMCLPFIPLDKLIKNKESNGRLKDAEDIKMIRKHM